MKKISLLLNILCFVFISFIVEGQINFNSSNLSNCTISNPTSLQFGPDGRLYVAQQDGTIKIFTVKRNASNNYTVISTETVLLVKLIPNHYDDGTLKPFNNFTNKRQVTGLYVTGTAANPIIYVCSSDSDIGAGADGDKNLCTNSGILSKLTWNGTAWQKMDLVRGLPRSEENHAPNGIQIDKNKQMLYLAIGGFTNAGSPSKLFAYISEYALSAAVLSIDLQAVEAMPTKDPSGVHPYKYDIPTLDDPTRSNNPDGTDLYDPFGGNDGLNMAKIVQGGPVQVFAPGLRNPYDLVITKTPGREGRMYITDNGANPNWGGYPDHEGPQGNATNNYVPGEPGSLTAGVNDAVVNNLDGLHKIDLQNYISGSYYGGHPCPLRANPAGAGLYTHDGTLETGVGVWRTSTEDPQYPLPSDWPPVPLSMAHPVEGDFRNPGVSNDVLLTFDASTNGICEYTASNFNNALKGDLLVINFEGSMYRIKLAADGSVLNSKGNKRLNQDPSFASGFGTKGLDITTQADNENFPGSIWVVNYGSNTITVFEPSDIICTGANSSSLDEDHDGYNNSDEILNGTDPCSAASKPDDNDLDLISDLNDTDDDNDGLADTEDPFAIDQFNGTHNNLPITYTLFNNDPGTGFFGLGFTGLMTNKTSDYKNLFDKQNLIAGGAIGAFTIDKVSTGDATGNLNNQQYAFQFGINTDQNTAPFMVRALMLGRFFNGNVPADFQSQGIYIGNGDQDNYLKVVLNANGGQGGIQVVMENQGVVTTNQYPIPSIPNSTAELIISVDPFTGIAQVKVSLDGGPVLYIQDDIHLAGPLLQTIQGPAGTAVGIISTSRNTTPFNASWDLIEVKSDPSKSIGDWEFLTSSDGSTPVGRHECGFVQCGNKFYLMGGRGVKVVSEYDPTTKTWVSKSKTPMELHHFQAVSFDNLIYVVCAFTGGYPDETPVNNIYIYDPATDKWILGREIPAERRRGSAGVVIYNKKIYIAGGIINGHQSGFVNWLDEYNPATNEWKVLPDAPHARDHFNAAVNNGKLYLVGGRRSSGATNQVFNLTVPEVDIYDFVTQTWTTNANNIPTPRAGTTTVTLNDEIIVMGGESMLHLIAHHETEAMNIHSGTWRSLDTMSVGRHATQAIMSNGGIYITGGSSSRGGSAATELTSVDEFHLTDKLPPDGIALVRSGLEVSSAVDFGFVLANSIKKDSLILKNVDGNQGVMIKNIKFRKNPNNLFSFTSVNTYPFFVSPDKNVVIPISFSASNTLPAYAELVIVHSGKGDSTVVSLMANTTQLPVSDWSPLYFVNAGGSPVTAENKTWIEDSPTSPSSYSNFAATFNKTSQVVYSGANNTDAPTYIFNSYRWDGGLKGNSYSNEMQWKFPAENGEYKIDLYFTESYATFTAPGFRVFDIMIEDTIRSDNFDIVAEAGFKNAMKKTYQLFIKDGFINIYFLHEIQNPIINGISIYKRNPKALAEISPSSLAFGDLVLNATSTKTVTVKNTGQIPFAITDVKVTGVDSLNFKNNFNAQITLQPGTSFNVDVTFNPLSAGNKTANLKIISPELSNLPSVALSGNGISGSKIITIIQPSNGSSYITSDSVKIEATVDAGSSTSYLKINCMDTKTRKLKIGYDPLNLYNPKRNVLVGGNNKVEIVLKAVTAVNWNKIQIHPQGSLLTPLVISNYMNQAENVGDGYVKVSIPLSDFNAAIDFTQLTLIEFPYSSGAGIFEMNLRSIVFTGGTTPFTWFGNGKTDNKQDGVGGSGQLLAELIMSSSKAVSNVLFYQNNNLLGSDNTLPYQYSWKNLSVGNYQLTAKVIFGDNSEETSNPVAISVANPNTTGMKVVVVFDQVPQNYSLSNATLKYDKDFAYSFTLDDGKEDAYTHAYQLMHGGHISFNNTDYPGLYYTDGCGHDVPFRAGLAWNSQNAIGQDPHINSTGYLKWTQMIELYSKNWNILNHSLNHKAGAGTDYNFQITENRRIIKEKTGLDIKHFVIPSGDMGYEAPAFNNGMIAVYNQSGNYPGANGGLKIDGIVNLSNFKLNRRYMDDNKYTPTNISDAIIQVDAKSINGNHYWYNDFTHKVSEIPSGGSLVFSTFEFYMKDVEQKFGKSGKDNVWMAPLEDVYEYIAVRNDVKYSTQLKGNKLEIYFDTTDVSSDLMKYALTLKIASDVNFSSIEASGFTSNSFRGTGNNKIINLEWKGVNAPPIVSSNIRTPKPNENVIYRVNVGGDEINNSGSAWESDLPYVISRKTSVKSNTGDVIIDNSMPTGIPKEIFSTERYTDDDSLSWEFPVIEGGEVEVRLYFAETEFQDTSQRVFDVAIEDSVKLKSFDIAASGGKDKAVMKTFTTTSDGTLDINLIKIKNNPSMRGIEIVCLNDRCSRKRIAMSTESTKVVSAFPNPTAEKVTVSFSTGQPDNVFLKIYDEKGNLLKAIEISVQNHSDMQMDLSDLETGIYYLKIISGDAVNETIKVIKQ